MIIQIARHVRTRSIPSPRLRTLTRRILSLLKQPKDTHVSILLTDDEEIHVLNRHWRHKDRPTDVLSFSMYEGGGLSGKKGVGLAPGAPRGGLLGDIVISLETCQRQAIEKRWSLEEELGFLLLHGILHLVGYDHERDEDHVVMEARTQELWSQLHPDVLPLLARPAAVSSRAEPGAAS